MSGRGLQLQVLKVLDLYLSLIQFSNLSKFSGMGGNGQESGSWGGSSLIGHEHLPASKPSQALKSVAVFLSPISEFFKTIVSSLSKA